MDGRNRDIAIIGRACRFPGGADSPDAFWNLLAAGTDAVTQVPSDRFDQRRFYHPDPGQKGRTYSFAAGTIGDVSGFDAEFFGIAAREAVEMDPQQRLLLELTHEALERAGIVPARLAGSDTAVYVGISGSDYAERRMGDLETIDPYFMLGSTLSIAANRISYIFDLRGPSMAIDTACSSSLVALHEAVQALKAGRSGLAIVGGVNLLLSPAAFVGFAKAMMLAKDGRCRAFGKGGEGYVRAEGGGVLVLKTLADAVRDGDPVLAVIRGTGVNTDGRTHGIALPSSASQEALLRKVYKDARVHPREISYFEAHGTGTAVGDPAEAGAIGRAIGRRRPKARPLPIGSVKSNIGHAEPAAGMAGLIKALGVLEHGRVPPSLHADELNPDIAFADLNIQLARESLALAAGPRIVGVNSFGFGGTNAHAVLEAWTPPQPNVPVSGGGLPLVLSARSEAALSALAAETRILLEKSDARDWRDIAFTAACRRAHHEHRLVLHAENPAQAAAGLGACKPQPGALARNARTALVFVGNGAQWQGMGKRLLEEDPVFRDAVAHIDAVARWRLGWSVGQALASGTASMDDTAVAQPLLFVLQVALVESLKARGLTFDGVVGHSVGEVAAAHIAGALSLEQAVLVIRERSEAQSRTRGQGRMLVAALGEDAALAEIARFGGALEIAAVNSPRSVTLSGDGAVIAALDTELKQRGIAARLLDLDYAFHSRSQDSTREGLTAALAGLTPAAPARDFYSTVSGGRLAALAADHWWRNIRQPVRFADAIAAMEEDGYRVFVEVGPHNLLQGNLRQILKAGRSLPTLTQTEDGVAAVTRARDQAWLLGAAIAWEKHFPEGGRVMPLPSYPWQRERHWYQPTPEAGLSYNTPQDAPLLGTRLAPHVPVWENLFTAKSLFADHCVEGSVVVPAAGFVEMALEAGALLFGADAALEIEGFQVARPLLLDAPRMVRFSMADSGFFRIESREHMRAGDWMSHVTGRLAALTAMPDCAPGAPGAASQSVSRADHYAFTADRGFGYGPAFQVLESATADTQAARADLCVPQAGPYRLHPALLDGLLQSIFPILRQHDDGGEAFVPYRFARLSFRPGAHAKATAHTVLTGMTRRAVTAQGVLIDEAGAPIVVLEAIRLVRLPARAAVNTPVARFNWRFEPLLPLVPKAVPEAAAAAARAALAQEAATADGDVLDRLAAAFAADALLALGETPSRDPALLARLIAMVEAHPDALGDPEEMWRAALAAHPEWITELALIGHKGRGLAARLAGDGPSAPSALREQLWDAPTLAGAKRALQQTAQAFAVAWPPNRRLRVLAAGIELALPDASCDVIALPDAAPQDRFDLAVALGDAPAAGTASLLLLARPRASAWTDLVLDGVPDTDLPGWRDVIRHDHGGACLFAATGLSVDLPADAPPIKDWLLLTNPAEEDLGAALVSALLALGHGARMQDISAPLPLGAPLHIVHLAGLRAPGLAAQARRCDALLAILRDERAEIGEMVLAVQGGLLRDARARPAQAVLAGVGRVLQNERPDISCRIIDLQPDDIADLAAEIAQGVESEVVLADGGRFGPRLVAADAPEQPLNDGEMQLLQSPGGGLDNLSWERRSRPAPQADEVEIAVAAAGLNFRDVMFALGLLPDELLEGGFAGATLGLEAAGIVTRTGAGVSDLRPGDKVVCFAPASLATHLVTRRFAVAKLPEGLGFAAGATLTAAFFTVTYALSHLAGLRRGERILIHGAAGGVGIAALQYARHVGAEIFATAGNDEKRDFARLLGADHVLDSRSLDFAAQIRTLTGGEGVDVVLNSLAGEAMLRGLSLLKPFGRFLELGKVDFAANSRVGLAAFRKNIAYHGVDADQLMAARPELAAEIFRETLKLFAEGVYTPLPYKVFERGQTVEAFRHMQRARHIGKVVLRTTVEAAAAPHFRNVAIDPQAAYLVTGGTSGFGLASAEWLAARGARHLVLVSRSGTADVARIEKLRAQGVQVELRACDVADEAAVRILVAEFACRLKGIIHAATVYDDATTAELTPQRLAAVLGPKAGGALALDRVTADLKLDLFLLYSSVSAAIGNPGQASYVAANLVLESLAARRRAQGRAAQIVALGPIADTGHLASRDHLAAAFGRLGMRPLAAAEVFAALDDMVLAGRPGLVVADIKWARLASALPSLKGGKFRRLTHGAEENFAADADFAALAASLPPAELAELLVVEVAKAIGQILHMAPERLNTDVSVFELGMDSLMGLELRMAIEARFGIGISAMTLSQDISIRRVAAMIQNQLTGADVPEPAAAPSAQSEQQHILSRHAEDVPSELIVETLAALDETARPRLIP